MKKSVLSKIYLYIYYIMFVCKRNIKDYFLDFLNNRKKYYFDITIQIDFSG